MLRVLALVFATVAPAAVSADPAPATSPAAADIPALISQLKSGYDSKSWSAVHMLAQLGATAVPALLAVVQDRALPDLKNVRSPARYQAVIALGYIGPPAAEAVPVLLTVLHDDSDTTLRPAAAGALGAIAARPDEIVPELARLLEEPRAMESGLAFAAVGALAAFARHPESHAALRTVLPAIKRADREFGPNESFVALVRLLAPPSSHQLADEALIEEVLIREIAKDTAVMWCVAGFRAEVVKSLEDLPVTDDTSQCSAGRVKGMLERFKGGSAPETRTSRLDRAIRSWRTPRLEYIGWRGEHQVIAVTTECFGYDPCHQTVYTLLRERVGWRIVAVDHPIAL